jgi:hypothetical protein
MLRKHSQTVRVRNRRIRVFATFSPPLRRTTALVLSVSLQAMMAPHAFASGQAASSVSNQSQKAARLTSAPTAADVDRFQQNVSVLIRHRDDRLRRLGDRLKTWIPIVSAKTNAERHTAVQKLPVNVLQSKPGDGRHGIFKTFVAGGKPRIQRFVPSVAISTDDGTEEIGGPRENRAEESTGRWKGGASGSCYWDAEDTGPDQCSPIAGRWKAGTSECYFDQYDSGPDQCSPANGRWESDGGCHWNPFGAGSNQCEPPSGGTGCFTNGVEDDCPTQQQRDDADALFSAALAELDSMQGDMDDYCNGNPGMCNASPAPFESGPSAYGENCGNQYALAGVAIAYAAEVTWLGWAVAGLAASGVGTVLLAGAAAGVMVGLAAVAVKNAWDCYLLDDTPADHYLVPAEEPVYN